MNTFYWKSHKNKMFLSDVPLYNEKTTEKNICQAILIEDFFLK